MCGLRREANTTGGAGGRAKRWRNVRFRARTTDSCAAAWTRAILVGPLTRAMATKKKGGHA